MGKTYILAQPYFMTDYILKAFDGDDNVIVYAHEHGHEFTKQVLRSLMSSDKRITKLCAGKLFSADYLNIINKIGPEDRLILWSVENLKDIAIISHLANCITPPNCIISFLWNPMKRVCRNSKRRERRYVEKMKELGVKVCTFDRGDAEEFGFDYVGQVYHCADDFTMAETDSPKTDVYFIGADKRRAAILADLLSDLKNEGLDCKFQLLKDKHSRPDDYEILKECWIDRPLSYDETLENIRNSKCLLEIVQSGQQGVTLRAMEALFFNKKLITDNAGIKKEEFYRPDNVYILDDPDQPWNSVREFIDSPPADIPAEIFEDHEIKTWINKLLSE